MPGNLQIKYGTAVTLSTTGMANLQTSSTFVLGWSTGLIDNTGTVATDYLISGQFALGTISSTNIGQIQVYAYGPLDPTPSGAAPTSWPGIFGSTAGVSGTLTVLDTEHRDAGLRLIWVAQEDGSIGDIYHMPPTSIAQAFGGSCPNFFALWITHNSVTSLSASNNVIYSLPVFGQYT